MKTIKRPIMMATALIVTIVLGLVGYFAYAAYSATVKIPSSGTLVPLPTDAPESSPKVTSGASLSIRETNGAILNHIYWGDHLTVHNAPTHQIMIENKGSVPLALSMSASTPSFATITWDAEGKIVEPNAYIVATIKLSFYQSINSQTIPFDADITITGTSA